MDMLERLLQLPGALATFEFRGSGELLHHRIGPAGLLGAETLDLLAHMCAANLSMAAMQARGWEKVTGMEGFYPVREVVLIGFDWSVLVCGLHRERGKTGGNEALPPFVGVVLVNGQADYRAALAAIEDPSQ